MGNIPWPGAAMESNGYLIVRDAPDHIESMSEPGLACRPASARTPPCPQGAPTGTGEVAQDLPSDRCT
jgi:hypothetical protein